MSELCINKSGSVYPVYDMFKNYAHVGDIMNREAFVRRSGDSGLISIDFLGPTGSYINASINTNKYPCGPKFESRCTSYPYGTANIGGRTYKTFYMRQSKNVYLPDASYWKTIPAGTLVATNEDTMGATHSDWKYIDDIRNSSGKWEGTPGNNGAFVDTGISVGSGYNSIAFYGSW